ncbi:MAG: hydroxysqualene dehydroxylase HpnE [Deltaproteobacteria bacterium]|nr:hydroxysqualene dehydroxylase HpnE [Deltaproteobacteria bacterium]
MPPPDVLIVGGGIAGLAAATELADSGLRPLILEMRADGGGRASSFNDPASGIRVDNGQHLLMGCYAETLRFLERIGARGDLIFQEQLEVNYLGDSKGPGRMRALNLPAPLHLLGGLLTFNLLSWRERFQTLRVGLAIQFGGSGGADESVRDWLTRLGQSRRVQTVLWDPITIATLNEEPERASAELLREVLRIAFFSSREGSRLVIPATHLSDLYVGRAKSWLAARGSEFRPQAHVSEILFDSGKVAGVRLRSGETILCGRVISAVPAHPLLSLLPQGIRSEAPFNRLEELSGSPIVSVNLFYDRPVTDDPFVALLDSPIHWVFNRPRILGEKSPQLHHYALIVSGARTLLDVPNDRICADAAREMVRVFPLAREAKLVRSVAVKDREATFAQFPGVNGIRPGPVTRHEGFYLAGDWTGTRLPATIESAALSGHQAARALLDKGQPVRG